MTATATRRSLVLGALLAAVAGSGSACEQARFATVDTLRIAGGEANGSYLSLARLLAAQATDQRIARRVEVRSSGGSVENLDLLAGGEVDVAPSLADAIVGRDRDDLVALGRICQNTLQCLVRASSPLYTLADLIGRRVAVGPEPSGTADSAVRLLVSAGVGTAEELGELWVSMDPGDSAVSLAGGTVDAMFWWGGMPPSEIAAIAEVEPLRLLDLAAYRDEVNALTRDVYQTVRVSGIYQPEAVQTLGVACLLICRADLADGLVAALVDILLDSGRLLVPQPANGILYFEPAALIDTAPVELHPAAVRRYRERHA